MRCVVVRLNRRASRLLVWSWSAKVSFMETSADVLTVNAVNTNVRTIVVAIRFRRFMMSSVSTNLDRVIQKLAIDVFEPVWRVIRDDDYLPLR